MAESKKYYVRFIIQHWGDGVAQLVEHWTQDSMTRASQAQKNVSSSESKMLC